MPDECAHFGRTGKERGCLPVDAAFVVFSCLISAMGGENLSKLTVANIGKRRREHCDDLGVHRLGRQDRGLGEQVVANQDYGAAVKDRIQRWLSAAEERTVDRVIVDE